MERSVLAVVAAVGLFGLLFVWLTPAPPPVAYAPPIIPLEYEPLPEGTISLDPQLIDEISEDPVTRSQLIRFTSAYLITTKNETLYSTIIKQGRYYVQPLDTNHFAVLSTLYGPAEETPINFSAIPYGLKHFNSTAPNIPEDIRKQALGVLINAGLNRRELIQGALALETEEERKAAWYLIANLAGEGFKTRRGRLLPDSRVMDAQTLYENVKYAVTAWKTFPWARKLGWDDFVIYILPHRVSKEPLQRWRKHFYEAFAPVLLQFDNEYDAAEFLHDVFQRIVVYEKNTDWEDQGLLTLLQTHQGRSGEMANLQTAFLRSVGLRGGEMIMYWWPHLNGNHGYNFALAEFAGEDYFIVFDDLFWDAPIARNSAKGYARAGFGKLVDATEKVAPVTSVTLQLDKPYVEAYWNVFNYGGWRTVATEETDATGKVTFDKIGNRLDYVYSVSYDPSPDEDPSTLALPPFILHADSTQMTPLLVESADISEVGELFVLGQLRPWTEYLLWRYSDEGFVEAATFTTNGLGEAELANGKDGRLYLLTRGSVDARPPYDRPFVYMNGKISFY